MADSIEQITQDIINFAAARGWTKYNENPKDMAISVVLEASELLEHFQWVKDEKLAEHSIENKEEISDELADVAIYLFQLAKNLDVDLLQAIRNKMKKNGEKYPLPGGRAENLL